jgi:hypothetical protein
LPAVGQPDSAQFLAGLTDAVPPVKEGHSPISLWFGETAEKELLAPEPAQSTLSARPLPPDRGLVPIHIEGFLAPPLRPPRA